MSEHPVRLFGAKWAGSPISENVEHVEVPVGQDCSSCATPITARQSGLFIWHIELDGTAEYRPQHRLCFLIPIIGPMVGAEVDSITCPVCSATSYNPNDVREGYCGRCHDWTTPR